MRYRQDPERHEYRLTEDTSTRVFVLIRELTDGNWGAYGRLWRVADIAEAMGVAPPRG